MAWEFCRKRFESTNPKTHLRFLSSKACIFADTNDFITIKDEKRPRASPEMNSSSRASRRVILCHSDENYKTLVTRPAPSLRFLWLSEPLSLSFTRVLSKGRKEFAELNCQLFCPNLVPSGNGLLKPIWHSCSFAQTCLESPVLEKTRLVLQGHLKWTWNSMKNANH